MAPSNVFSGLEGLFVYLVGIKGTGMAAMAELLQKRGVRVTGSDGSERFYTDLILQDLGIPYFEGFRRENLPEDVDLVIHSAAYNAETNPELKAALERGLPVMTYPEALGMVSALSRSVGIAGTHGKTTTAGLCASIAGESGLPVSVLVGSAVSNLGGRSTFVSGDDFFIAETCEYRRHFLHFSPELLVFTNIEADHLDYFSGYNDVIDAFVDYGKKLPENGGLIFCADDPGAKEAAGRIAALRGDVRLLPYGFAAEGPFRLEQVRRGEGFVEFVLVGSKTPYRLKVPGEHNALNAAAAAAVFAELYRITGREDNSSVRRGIGAYAGSSRRSEIVGEAGGVLFLDDYGHHPTEIKTTIKGMKEFYPGRRLVVDFMSHTYTRTAALFDQFAGSFIDADEVVLHKIYASARETADRSVTGKQLFEAVRSSVPLAVYFHEVMDAEDYLANRLAPGDVFLTMGAGDNWRIGRALYRRFGGKDEQDQEQEQEK